jgi:hypothetical protein
LVQGPFCSRIFLHTQLLVHFQYLVHKIFGSKNRFKDLSVHVFFYMHNYWFIFNIWFTKYLVQKIGSKTFPFTYFFTCTIIGSFSLFGSKTFSVQKIFNSRHSYQQYLVHFKTRFRILFRSRKIVETNNKVCYFFQQIMKRLGSAYFLPQITFSFMFSIKTAWKRIEGS